MCLIKSMTATAMLIVLTTAYANDCQRSKSGADILAFKMFWGRFLHSYKNIKNATVNDHTATTSINTDLQNFSRALKDTMDFDCCNVSTRRKIDEAIVHNSNIALRTVLALELDDAFHGGLIDELRNLRTHFTVLPRTEFDETALMDIPRYNTINDNRIRNKQVFDELHNVFFKNHGAIGTCEPDKRKRIVGHRSGIDQPKLEARNPPLPAESAATGRSEYVVRENRAFHQEPDQLDRGSVGPLEDMARQIRVFDKLQEIREALKRSDELLVHPMDNDDMWEVRGYDQQARPRMVAKRNEFLTNTWVDGDAPDTHFEEAKRDAETLGPFAGKRRVRPEALDQAQEFKRQLLNWYSKKWSKI